MWYIAKDTKKKNDVYLAHHGIKGQKWGVRRYQNEDGTLTNEGRKRYYKALKKWYKSDSRAYDKMPQDIDGMDSIKRINNNLAESLNEYKQITNEIESAVSDYKKNRSYWSAVSGATSALLWGDTRMDSMASRIIGSMYDDLDQGYMNSAAIWAHETGKTNAITKLSRKEADVYKRFEDDVKNEVNNMLDKYGNKKIEGHSTLASKMVNSILNSSTESMPYGIADDASQGPRTKNEADSIKVAKNIVGKLSLGKGKNNAWYLHDAIEKCGLSNTDFRDMTNSDWQKLSSELSKMSR